MSLEYLFTMATTFELVRNWGAKRFHNKKLQKQPENDHFCHFLEKLKISISYLDYKIRFSLEKIL